MSEITADIVIAGGTSDQSRPLLMTGGTAGCVIAGRLSDAFPDLDIVVIENGPDSKDDPLIDRKTTSDRHGTVLIERTVCRYFPSLESSRN